MKDFFPVGELIDRYLIALIKFQKTGLNLEELNWYNERIKNFDLDSIRPEMDDLKQAHLNIWAMESSLRSGLEENVGFEEIGRRAIKIRDYNGQRIIAKNAIAKKLNCPVIEYKKDHLSE
jgi:hypothetical protein